MARTRYTTKKISGERLELIEVANAICAEYAAGGMVLTLRQLYYQFVARGLIANRQSSYDQLSDVCKDARMNGLMDWDYLIDRTRNLQSFSHWSGPQDVLEKSAEHYNRDLWANQRIRVEVWIEKDAAIGTIEGVCWDNRLPFFSCRGYTSVSEMHAAAQRIRWYIEKGDQVVILHIGDHDPSGLDMSRDIEDRLRQFIAVDWAGLHMGQGAWTRGQIRLSMLEHMEERGNDNVRVGMQPWEVRRIALNIDQIERYSPPPNPAKQSDVRYRKYVEATGLDESWELDALEPSVLAGLIQDQVDALRDERLWRDANLQMERERLELTTASLNWDSVSRHLTSITKGQPDA